MGAATPAFAAVNPWLAGAGMGLGLLNTVVRAGNANAAADAQADALRQQAENQRQLAQRQFDMDQRRRQSQLDRAAARARASFGARGLSATDGSAGALLDGLEADAGEEEADARSLLDHRRRGLDAGLAASLQRVDANRPDLLSASARTAGQVNQLLRWAK